MIADCSPLIITINHPKTHGVAGDPAGRGSRIDSTNLTASDVLDEDACGTQVTDIGTVLCTDHERGTTFVRWLRKVDAMCCRSVSEAAWAKSLELRTFNGTAKVFLEEEPGFLQYTYAHQECTVILVEKVIDRLVKDLWFDPDPTGVKYRVLGLQMARSRFSFCTAQC